MMSFLMVYLYRKETEEEMTREEEREMAIMRIKTFRDRIYPLYSDNMDRYID